MQFHMHSMSAQEYSHLHDTARFQSSTLVGNWNEEREMRRSMMKDLLAKRGSGTMKLDAFGQRMSVALADLELTKMADDPYVHFGDIIQLVHLETGSVLACDLGERDTRPGEESCATTGAAECRAPCARNTLIILKHTGAKNSAIEPDYGNDGIVRYGQKVRIAFNPMALGEAPDMQGGPRPLVLFSKPVSTTHAAKYCRHQLVAATFRTSSDAVWMIMTPDPKMRTASEGVEVMAGAPILLMHVPTQKALLLENQRYPNEFGVEWELSARNSTTQGLKSALQDAQNGLLKGNIPKSGMAENLWVVMTGTKIAALPDSSISNSAAVRSLIALVESVSDLSVLERKIVTHSSANSELPAEDLVLLVRQCNSTLSNFDIYELMRPFMSASKPGIIEARDFLAALLVVLAWLGLS
eukprot:gene18594-25106_t